MEAEAKEPRGQEASLTTHEFQVSLGYKVRLCLTGRD